MVRFHAAAAPRLAASLPRLTPTPVAAVQEMASGQPTFGEAGFAGGGLFVASSQPFLMVDRARIPASMAAPVENRAHRFPLKEVFLNIRVFPPNEMRELQKRAGIGVKSACL